MRIQKVQAGPMVHPTSIVSEKAEIGQDTRIWHFCHVMEGVRIGRRCVLGQNVFVAPDVVVGDGCKIQNNVSLYQGVILEEDVFCGPSIVFTNVLNPRAAIERKHEFRSTLVGRGASLGANATIVCGNSIGRYAMVGAGAVVTGDVPDFGLVYGLPARRMGWVCRCGTRLAMGSREGICHACGTEYLLMAPGKLKEKG